MAKTYKSIVDRLRESNIKYDTYYDKTPMTDRLIGLTYDTKFNQTDVTSNLNQRKYDTSFEKSSVTMNLGSRKYDTLFNKTDVTSDLSSRKYDTLFNKTDVTSGERKYDTVYDKTSMITRYQNMDPKPFEQTPRGGSNLANYYRKYGYTAGVATLGGFFIGTNSATDIAENVLSHFVPGTSRSTIRSFGINIGKSILRDPYVSSTLDAFIPSTNALNLPTSKIVPAQTIPGELLLARHGLMRSNYSTSDLISTGINAFIPSVMSGLTTTGTATTYDLKRVFESGLDTMNKIMLAQSGLKYTKNVGFLDTTMTTWKTHGEFTNMTFDKYSGYRAPEETRDLNPKATKALFGVTEQVKKNASKYDSSINLDRYKSTLGIDVPKFDLTGETAAKITNLIDDKDKYLRTLNLINRDGKYSSQQDIANFASKLGFPIINRTSDGGTTEGSVDTINMMDVGDDYNENVRDFIKFKFEDISTEITSTPIIFRATMANLNDSVSPSWNEHKFIGRADMFYTYIGYTRTISFDFTVYVNSVRELPTQWRKINRLYGMCYPAEYENKIVMRAPIVRLTLGDMYNGIYGKFDSLSITPDENSFWEVEDGLQLPHIVTINVSFTVMYEPNDKPPITNSRHFMHKKEEPATQGTIDNITENIQDQVILPTTQNNLVGP